jgi:ATP-dependent DNA helicase RecQ
MSTSSALSAAPSAASTPAERWNLPCVCIDIETPATGEAILHKLAAFRPDTGARISFQGKFSPADVTVGLDTLAAGAELVLGHNIKRHDLPVLTQLYPGLALAKLPS